MAKELNLRRVLMRIFDVYIVCFILSVLFMAFYESGLISGFIGPVSFGIAFVYLAWNVWCLYLYRMSVHGIKRYYLHNFLYIGILCLIATLTLSTENDTLNRISTFLFVPFKTFFYLSQTSGKQLTRLDSAVVYSVILLILTAVIPFIAGKRRRAIPNPQGMDRFW